MGVAALPISIGVAILKYRLYDIDRIISWTLAYAIVTGLLYVGLRRTGLLATRVLRFHSTVAVAASTLVVAALFNPVRRRVQHAADRRFNRARYDAEQLVAAFAARLQDAVTPTRSAPTSPAWSIPLLRQLTCRCGSGRANGIDAVLAAHHR